jgi:putative phosphoesterase
MKTIISNYDKIDMIIHLGDNTKDLQQVKKHFPDISYEYVSGNCDLLSSEPSQKTINICDKKIFITHGHDYGVKTSTHYIENIGKEMKVDAVFFGHTHMPVEFFYEDILYVNPGSLGKPPNFLKRNYCEITIEKDEIKNVFKSI